MGNKKIHKCLLNDSLPDMEKEWLSRNYTEKQVKLAIEWVDHPLNASQANRKAAIRIALLKMGQGSKNKKDKLKESIKKNKEHAKEVMIKNEKDISKESFFEIHDNFVKVGFCISGFNTVISYDHEFFESELQKAFYKYRAFKRFY